MIFTYWRSAAAVELVNNDILSVPLLDNATIFSAEAVNKPYNFSLIRQDAVLILRIRNRAFQIYSFVLLKRGERAGIHILQLPTKYTTHFSGAFRHISSEELSFS